MKVNFDTKEIVFNKVEASFINRVNHAEKGDNLITLSVYWGEPFFRRFVTKVLKFGSRGSAMDTDCYEIPSDFRGIDLSKLDFQSVVTACGFTKNCSDDADRYEGYNEDYKIVA